MEFEFNLKLKFLAEDAKNYNVTECLGGAGCTDALVGLGTAGYVRQDLIREADSAEATIVSALADVKRALPMAMLVEAGPDFVGFTDVADLVGMRRQDMRIQAMEPGERHAPNSSREKHRRADPKPRLIACNAKRSRL